MKLKVQFETMEVASFKTQFYALKTFFVVFFLFRFLQFEGIFVRRRQNVY